MAKNSFILYYDQKEVIDELTDEQAGKLFKAIYEYNVEKKIKLTGALKLVFIPFKTAFDRNDEKWEETAEQRSEAGKRHTGNQYTRKKEKEMEQMEQAFQNGTNGTNGTVSVSVSDSVNVNVSDSVSVNVNTPNTHTTIFDYCVSIFKDYNKNDLEKSCKKFFNHYNEKKWKGVNDWQKKLELWINDDIDNGKIKEKEQDDDYVDEAGFHYKNGRRVL